MEFSSGRLHLRLIEEWSQFFQPCNWRTFHFAHLMIEDEEMMGDLEVCIILLGLGFQIVWSYSDTETRRRIRSDIDRLTREFEDDP